MKSIRELMNLSDRVSLITGGAGHIGYAIAEALAEAGSEIILADLPASKPAEKAKALNATGIECDLSEERSILDLAKKIQAKGRIDVIVHAAALVGTSQIKGWAVPFSEQSSETFDHALHVNLTSAFTLVRELTPLLTKSGHGSVIFISSTYGLVGPDLRLYEGTSMGNPLAYGASKAALIQLSKYMATSLAPKVRVNCLTPGGVERGQPKSFQEKYIFRTPLGRMAREEDFKGAALYLASDLSAYVTGQNLVVDGGWTAW